METQQYIEDAVHEAHEKISNIRLAMDILEKAYDGYFFGNFEEMELAINCIQTHIRRLSEVSKRLRNEIQR